MTIQDQINAYIGSLPDAKGRELQELHQRTVKGLPRCKLWFDSGINSEGKVVCNPTIGYGAQTITYADGKTKEIFRVGISANKNGISVYILGLSDKTYLARTYGDTIGKATITGYCIKFRSMKDIDASVLDAAIVAHVS